MILNHLEPFSSLRFFPSVGTIVTKPRKSFSFRDSGIASCSKVLVSSTLHPGFTLMKAARANTAVLPPTFASHQILTGRSRDTSYALGRFSRQFSTARGFGQICSGQFMRGDCRVEPVTSCVGGRILPYATVSEFECRSVVSSEDRSPDSSHVGGQDRFPITSLITGLTEVSRGPAYSIAANTWSSDTVANVVA